MEQSDSSIEPNHSRDRFEKDLVHDHKCKQGQ